MQELIYKNVKSRISLFTNISEEDKSAILAKVKVANKLIANAANSALCQLLYVPYKMQKAVNNDSYESTDIVWVLHCDPRKDVEVNSDGFTNESFQLINAAIGKRASFIFDRFDRRKNWRELALLQRLLDNNYEEDGISGLFKYSSSNESGGFKNEGEA